MPDFVHLPGYDDQMGHDQDNLESSKEKLHVKLLCAIEE